MTILSLESTTKVCSVALSRDGKVIALKESRDAEYTHAEKLNVYIEAVLEETGISPKELDAVAVAGGPGSYTGLRIGVSSAKGLCYATGKPLIAVDPLKALAAGFIASTENQPESLIFPMIDARRDEVFMAVFTFSGERVEETSAQIITKDFFTKYPDRHCVLIGDGAAKFTALFEGNPQVKVVQDHLASAVFMVDLAENKFNEGLTENLAYYEPFYGKEFQTTVSKKLSNIRTNN